LAYRKTRAAKPAPARPAIAVARGAIPVDVAPPALPVAPVAPVDAALATEERSDAILEMTELTLDEASYYLLV
jgi:hypothetical protein